jgi:CHAD domain-containing protein
LVRIQQYAAELLGQVGKNYHLVKESFSEEAVHDLRVSIKKLRAVSRFIRHFDQASEVKEALGPFRQIFKAFGTLRELQIAFKLANEWSGDQKTKSRVKRAFQAEIKKTADVARLQLSQSEIDIDHISSVFLKNVTKSNIAEDQIHDYLDLLRDKIGDCEGRFSSKEWHKKRINLKFYRHTLDMLTFLGIRSADSTHIKEIQILEALLGDWHDRIMSIRHISLVPESDGLVRTLRYEAGILKASSRLYLKQFDRM